MDSNVSTALIEHGTHGSDRLSACFRRSLELQRFGFTCRGQRGDLFRRHGRISFFDPSARNVLE